MLRSATARRPRIDILTFNGAHQRRRRTFLRQEPKDGEDEYYTINKEYPFAPKEIPIDKLFKISDLLLDLDDVDSKHVRPVTEQDETALEQKWKAAAAIPEKIVSRVGEIEARVSLSRFKAFELSSLPANAWRVTNHDLLSVALRGGLKRAPLIDSEEEAHHGEASALKASKALDPRREPSDMLHNVCLENGISNYATQDDKLLLHWLLSRRRIAGPLRNGVPPSAKQFTAALNQQTTISSIRRLVSQCLSSGLDATMFQTQPRRHSGQPQNNLSYEIRKSCINILGQAGQKDASVFGALTFLGNLEQRLASQHQSIGGSLCGLGLMLSARIGNLDATMEYLVRGFKHRIWVNTPGALPDTLRALEALSQHLTAISPEGPFVSIPNRQLLLGLLTGLDVQEGKNAWAVSFRALVLLFIENCSGEDYNLAAGLYKAYILALGRSGATATLWKEWQLLGAEIEQQTRTGKILQSEDGSDVKAAFMAAIGAASSVVARREDALPMDIGLADCVTLDLELIEMQDPKVWCDSKGNAEQMGGLVNNTMHATPGGGHDGWLAAVDSASEQRPRPVGG